jgi:serine/threonine protein kinase
VTAQIGAGGMGEVYKARDTRLDRTVAIKILPEAFAPDADRLARFQREAKTLASLNHPNIAIVHGLEQADDVHALVMEHVEGEDLSQRIARGPIAIDEALPIAKQIAEALEAAHEQGIIHRDLKPGNVKARPDGIVKVLDFGLAKALEPLVAGSTDATASPTITSPAMMTSVGVMRGTAAYMSPEQAKGRQADKRRLSSGSRIDSCNCSATTCQHGTVSRVGHRLRRNASSAPLSVGDRVSPKTCPETARVVTPGGLHPPGTKSGRRRAGSNISSRVANEPSCSSLSRYHTPRRDGIL